MEEFVEPCTITVLGCHETHFFHEDCLKYWMEAEKKKGITCTCPICRRPIEESKMESKAYKGLQVVNVDEIELKGDDDHQEMFGIYTTEKKLKGNEDIVIEGLPEIAAPDPDAQDGWG
jgi:hypothetical protein